MAALSHRPRAFPVGCLGWQEFDGLVADAERFFGVYAREGIVVRGMEEELAC